MHVLRTVYCQGEGVLLRKTRATKGEVTQTKLGRHAPAAVPLCQNPDTQHLAPFAPHKRDASAGSRHGFRRGTRERLLCNRLVSGYRCISGNRDMLVRRYIAT